MQTILYRKTEDESIENKSNRQASKQKAKKCIYIYKTVESRKISFDTRVAYLSQSNQEEFQR